MKHLDFVVWVIGWVWVLSRSKEPTKDVEVLFNLLWLGVWIGIGGLVFFF